MRRVSKQEWENEHMHNPMTEGEALAVLDTDAIASSLVDWMLTKAMPNGDLLHASVACDYAGTANFKRALSKQLRAALREQPEARGVVDATWQHAANEWADIATNAVVWLRNVRDGIATFDAAIADMERGYAHCRAQQPVLTAAQQPAPPSAPVGVDEKAREILADEYRQAGFYGAADDALADEPSPHCKVTIKAIERALAQQPAQAAPGDFVVVDGRSYALDTVRTALLGLAADVAATPPGDDAAGGGHD